jgi:hypothetical protein
MIDFDTMTAMASATRSRATPPVRNDLRSKGFARMGIDQHCGRNFAPGGA